MQIVDNRKMPEYEVPVDLRRVKLPRVVLETDDDQAAVLRDWEAQEVLPQITMDAQMLGEMIPETDQVHN